MTKCVALYCRLSPRPDGSYEGVPLQEQWGREYAARTWPDVPIEVFADTAISAANGDHRPEFERFREWLAAGRIGHVWAVEQSRLERREVEWFRLAAELDAAGISELHTNRDGVLRVRDEIAGIRAVINAGEVRKLKRRVNDRLAEVAASGAPPGGVQFGYRKAVRDDGVKTYAIVEEEAAIIRDAAARVLDGWSLTAIVTDLRERGVRGSRGGEMGRFQLRSWLTRPSVAAKRVYRGEIVGDGNWPPILSEDTWRAVVAKLSQPRRVKRSDGGENEVTAKFYGRSTTRRYVLTGGFAVCGKCGGRLAGRDSHNGRPGPYLICLPKVNGGCSGTGIQMEAVMQYVLDSLWTELDKPDFLRQIGADDHEQQRHEITTKLAAVDARKAELAAMWADDTLDAAEWAAARERLAKRKAELTADLNAVPAPMVDIDITQAREAWPSMTLDEQRELLGLFIERVVVGRATRGRWTPVDDRVEIEWRTRA